MTWRMENDCLRMDSPVYHDEGSPLQYSVEAAPRDGHWMGMFEGALLYIGPSIIDALAACEKDAFDSRGLKFQDDEERKTK